MPGHKRNPSVSYSSKEAENLRVMLEKDAAERARLALEKQREKENQDKKTKS